MKIFRKLVLLCATLSSCTTLFTQSTFADLKSIIDKRLELDDLQVHQAIEGDFNRDGKKDAYCVISYKTTDLANKEEDSRTHSLAIVMDKKSKDGLTYQIRSKQGRYNFKNIAVTLMEKPLKEVKADGDAIILPNNFGDKDYIYLEKNKLKQFTPGKIL